MKQIQHSLHYLRIHAKVWRRLWSEIPNRMRDVIAADTEHRTEAYQWFEGKVAEDSMRLYTDPNYYDNADYTFRIQRSEQVAA